MIREMHDATKGRAAIDDSLDSCKYVYDIRMKLERALAQAFGDGNHSPSARSINEEIRKCSDPLMVIARALWLYDSVPTDAQSNVAAVMDRVVESAKANLNAVNAELIAKNAHEVAAAARDRQSWDLNQDVLRAVRGTTAYATVGADCGEQQDAEQKHMDSLIAELADLDIRINKLTTLIDHVDVGAYHMSVLNIQLTAMKTQRVALARRIDEVSDHGEGVGHGI